MQLREPANRVSPRAKPYWALSSGLGWLTVIAIQLALVIFIDDTPWWRWTALGLSVVGLVVGVLVQPPIRYRIHRWEVTPTAVYTQSGWISTARRVAPISRVQTVDTSRSGLQRVFGLSSVSVTTASSAGTMTIDCLDASVADELVEHLTVVTEQSRDDAT
ncbi:hypothetical protein FB554_2468 [Barrientosiimonas humi]|uniref:YdbS-like PH domain-containing protein n=1 Tax=Barrientosiimonas humi TaxID=999931 RepID=A0A542XEQ0_9MICO|nr:PH domain-containing protein [Barrientosiimonas humi]TQL34303.1 hypothetical protein FB554_2468 [Barrientosiimonas humi]CAG7574294.1 hypothetical protein BH39T_PBIAJDOK_02940 [Barrientosiimonas humi]